MLTTRLVQTRSWNRLIAVASGVLAAALAAGAAPPPASAGSVHARIYDGVNRFELAVPHVREGVRLAAFEEEVQETLRRKAEAADACAHFLLERCWHRRAVEPLELVTSADERIDRRLDVGGSVGHAERAQQAVEELR